MEQLEIIAGPVLVVVVALFVFRVKAVRLVRRPRVTELHFDMK